MSGPLQGYRILDLTTVFLGPYAAQILGDLGAEVIKVETPEGDIVRGIEPSRNPGMGSAFLSANRNKRGLALDLKKPAGRDAFLKLVAGSDALVSSVRPAGLERLGLGYEDCRRVNPKIVYCNIVGFGQDGPYAAKPAYDDIIQGLSGMAAAQAATTGEPRYVNQPICDKITSQVSVYAVVAALLHRERTGEGQQVEVPMLETLVGFNMLEHQAGTVFDPPLGGPGYTRVLAPFRRPYATADGYVCVLPYSTKQWRAFLSIVGREDLYDDPRITDPKTRSEKVGEMYEIVAEAVKDRGTDELLAAVEEADVPAGKVNMLDEIADDPHLAAVGFFQHYDHPTEGRVRHTGIPVKFGAGPCDVRCLAPNLGEHSREVLLEAGLSDDEIDALVADGVAVDGGRGE